MSELDEARKDVVTAVELEWVSHQRVPKADAWPRFQDALDSLIRAAQQEAVAPLVEAAEPFALLLAHVERQPVQGDDKPIWATGEATVTQGMVREIVAALAAVREQRGSVKAG